LRESEDRGKREEEEPQNANIPYIRIPIVRDRWGRLKVTFYLPKSMEQTFRRFVELCRQDQLSYSRVICRLIRTWVLDHEPGNVQQRLADTEYIPPYEYDLFPVEKRRQLMEDLLRTIEANPSVPLPNIAAAFAVESGLREETVITYIRTLRRAGKLRRP